MIALYLAAIVAANLAVTAWGPGASIPIAFLLIGLDLTARDRLHDRWRGRGLPWRMGALIAAGGAISYLLNQGAGRVAVASVAAFTLASITDAAVYQLLRDRPYLQRVNGSNVPAALVDSVAFPTLAFGAVLPWIMAGQLVAKIAGGALWALILKGRQRAAASA